ncbi:bifunctional 2-polyprenyl-6-hydroxyphenol methylase/3-demethylubiquinol 3-O-methyltransferase UbiG [Geobacter sp. DSM 9736]|uniref:class I SAM-dependent methyltransferase n=1 Tax=Geobacter sp. DSM 9736 TaxID=1277350 RepID=UPI000B5004D9|nr:class I SAM-dependent methyltransferase [Geobacter sp. DSM 9736]SNB47970.1 Methyltransferase domain-containing protein [Geobacter sp. DSM 9736]
MYDMKKEDYFTHCRMDMLGVIPPGDKKKILEIGAGTGVTLLQAKALGLADEIVGVELVPLEKSCQRHPDMDQFIIGDVERLDLPFREDYFDVILCGDVLEHLVDPWRMVRRLAAWLKPGGCLIASIPNVREIKTVLKIVLKGNFRYDSAGIMDRTHLRFFCKRDMLDLFEQNGLDVLRTISNLELLGKGKRVLLNRLTLGALSEFLEGEYLMVARKPERR